MIFRIPLLTAEDQAVLDLISEQRKALRFQVNNNPQRWSGFLRRSTFARSLQGSNSIEGYNASMADAVAIVDNERPETPEEETVKALSGYRTAMTYVLQLQSDPYFVLNEQVIKSLHFMMLSYDLTKLPGQWRPGSIYVVNEPSGDTVYEGPDAELVPTLMAELVSSLGSEVQADPLVLGAMAHLNLTMIHPFRDGNGRMARSLQTLVMARNGLLSPIYGSIEEWLGHNTQAYYNILAETGQGHWNPWYDAHPWVRFCIVAHYQQAATLLRRNREIGRVWTEISELSKRLAIPERSETTLVDAAFGYRVRNSRYREENSVSDVVASRELKKLCDLGLLQPVGEARGRYYMGSDTLRGIRDRLREVKKVEDPYELVKARKT